MAKPLLDHNIIAAFALRVAHQQMIFSVMA
jgi:hypothetical protein